MVDVLVRQRDRAVAKQKDMEEKAAWGARASPGSEFPAVAASWAWVGKYD